LLRCVDFLGWGEAVLGLALLEIVRRGHRSFCLNLLFLTGVLVLWLFDFYLLLLPSSCLAVELVLPLAPQKLFRCLIELATLDSAIAHTVKIIISEIFSVECF